MNNQTQNVYVDFDIDTWHCAALPTRYIKI